MEFSEIPITRDQGPWPRTTPCLPGQPRFLRLPPPPQKALRPPAQASPSSSISTASHGATVKVESPSRARFFHCLALVWVRHSSSFHGFSHLLGPMEQPPGAPQSLWAETDPHRLDSKMYGAKWAVGCLNPNPNLTCSIVLWPSPLLTPKLFPLLPPPFQVPMLRNKAQHKGGHKGALGSFYLATSRATTVCAGYSSGNGDPCPAGEAQMTDEQISKPVMRQRG